MGNPISNTISFVLCIVLGSSAIASLLTLIAAIASKTNNGGGIMAVLSMPLLFPLLINLIKTSEICLLENEFYVDNQILFLFLLNIATVLPLTYYFRTFGVIKKPTSMQLKWWKILGIILVLYSFIAGLLMPVPRLDILNETIRNLYFHVTMWFSMILLMFISMIQSLIFLNSFNKIDDLKAESYASTGIFMGY